jgi:anti-sigma factor RsiW
MEHEEVHELTAAYALDALSDEEEAELEEHLRHCPACREKLAAFHDTAASLAYAAPPAAPSPDLRERILEKAREERTKVVPLRPRRTYRALTAVAAVLALSFGIWAIAATRSLSNERSARDRLETQMALLADPASKRVSVTGAEGELVFAPDGKAALVLNALDPAPAGRTYEAWVSVDGAMRPAGTFDSSGGRTVFLLGRELPPGAGVAVTVEPGQGSAQPSGAPIISAETT